MCNKALQSGGKEMKLKGGANLFIRIELLPNMTLPRRVEGSISVNVKRGEDQAVYFVGKEWDGGKAITSPLFFTT
jgi:hypothetical protein